MNKYEILVNLILTLSLLIPLATVPDWEKLGNTLEARNRLYKYKYNAAKGLMLVGVIIILIAIWI